MKLKKDAKFGEESTRCLKIGIKNLTNFDLRTRKVSKFFILMGSYWLIHETAVSCIKKEIFAHSGKIKSIITSWDLIIF